MGEGLPGPAVVVRSARVLLLFEVILAAICYDSSPTWSPTASNYSTNYGGTGTVTIVFDPCSTTYTSNLPDSYFEESQLTEDDLLAERKARQREQSILALLELKDQHHRAKPPSSPLREPYQVMRRSGSRRSATGVRNWRRVS